MIYTQIIHKYKFDRVHFLGRCIYKLSRTDFLINCTPCMLHGSVHTAMLTEHKCIADRIQQFYHKLKIPFFTSRFQHFLILPIFSTSSMRNLNSLYLFLCVLPCLPKSFEDMAYKGEKFFFLLPNSHSSIISLNFVLGNLKFSGKTCVDLSCHENNVYFVSSSSPFSLLKVNAKVGICSAVQMLLH